MASKGSATTLNGTANTINPWRSQALVGSYVVIVLVSAAFIYMMYQASQIISRSNPRIDAGLYFETHLSTFIAEIVLWIIIARAAIHLKAYTRVIKSSPDGQALNIIANAFLISLLYAMLFGMASTTKTLFWHTPYLDTATTVSNLLPLAVVLLFAILLFIGSVKLISIVNVKRQLTQGRKHITIVAAYAVIASLYACYLYREASHIVDDDGLRHFALAPSVLLFVYITPYLTVWLLGLLSCLNIGY
jgi:hypothetical protein